MSNYKKIPLLNICSLNNFPFIEADFDAVTYYQLLCKIVDSVNDTIELANNLLDEYEEMEEEYNRLIALVNELQSRLDTIQEELTEYIDLKNAENKADEAYDLRGEAFLRYIYDELTYRIAKKIADTMIAKIEACGTVSTTTCPSVAKITSTTASLGLVASAIAQLSDEAADPVVIMNKLTYAAFKQAQYAANFAADPFEGLSVEFNSTVKALSAASSGDTWMIVGDLDHGALANFPNGEGIDFKFDELTLKKQDLIEVLGREFVALGVVAPKAFCKVVK